MPERAPRAAHRELVQRLPAGGEALAGAREMVESLDELSRPVRDDLALLVTELVGNSLRHAGLGPDEWVRVRLVLQTGSVRVTAQRLVYASERFDQVKSAEPLNAPEFYREFFARLEKSALLEKQTDAL